MWDQGYVLLEDADLRDRGMQRAARERWLIAARADAFVEEPRVARPVSLEAPKLHGLRRWWRRLRWKEL